MIARLLSPGSRSAPVPGGPLGRADHRLLRFLRTRGHDHVTETTMKAVATAGEYAAVWIAIGALGALVDAPRRRRWLAAATSGPLAVGINFAVKAAVGRDRPLLEDHPRLGRAPTELSFPSAHATSSLAAAIALGRVEPRLRPPLLGLAAAICVSRPYLGMHYPSDVLAGAVLGSAIGALVPGPGRPADEARLIHLGLDASTRHSPPLVAEPNGATSTTPRPA